MPADENESKPSTHSSHDNSSQTKPSGFDANAEFQATDAAVDKNLDAAMETGQSTPSMTSSSITDSEEDIYRVPDLTSISGQSEAEIDQALLDSVLGDVFDASARPVDGADDVDSGAMPPAPAGAADHDRDAHPARTFEWPSATDLSGASATRIFSEQGERRTHASFTTKPEGGSTLEEDVIDSMLVANSRELGAETESGELVDQSLIEMLLEGRSLESVASAPSPDSQTSLHPELIESLLEEDEKAMPGAAESATANDNSTADDPSLLPESTTRREDAADVDFAREPVKEPERSRLVSDNRDDDADIPVADAPPEVDAPVAEAPADAVAEAAPDAADSHGEGPVDSVESSDAVEPTATKEGEAPPPPITPAPPRRRPKIDMSAFRRAESMDVSQTNASVAGLFGASPPPPTPAPAEPEAPDSFSEQPLVDEIAELENAGDQVSGATPQWVQQVEGWMETIGERVPPNVALLVPIAIPILVFNGLLFLILSLIGVI